jgi:hypothetical protein
MFGNGASDVRTANWMSKAGAVFYALWGVAHVIGAGLQLFVVTRHGGAALTALISSAKPLDPATVTVPEAAEAFMMMGAYNIFWIGFLVTVVAVRMNWRNSDFGYWLNLVVVGAVDLGLLLAMLLPGHMAWSDGVVGVALFALAVGFSTFGRIALRSVDARPHAA